MGRIVTDRTDANSMVSFRTHVRDLPPVRTSRYSFFIKRGDSSYCRNDTYAFTRNSSLETLRFA